MLWLLPTRNRPHMVVEYINACEVSGCIPDHAVMVDQSSEENVDKYRAIKWPDNWRVHYATEHMELTKIFNYLWNLYPGYSAYGETTDHARPRTADWSGKLEKVAGDWYIANSVNQHDRRTRKNCGWGVGLRRLNAAAFGAKLLDLVGWFWLPATIHLGGDDCWEAIGYEAGILKFCDTVFIGDLAAWKGEFPKDENHQRLFKGTTFHLHDQMAKEEFIDKELQPLVERIIARVH